MPISRDDAPSARVRQLRVVSIVCLILGIGLTGLTIVGLVRNGDDWSDAFGLVPGLALLLGSTALLLGRAWGRFVCMIYFGFVLANCAIYIVRAVSGGGRWEVLVLLIIASPFAFGLRYFALSSTAEAARATRGG